MIKALGETYRVVLPIFSDGIGITGQAPILTIQIASNGHVWDFTNDIFTNTPDLDYVAMDEDLIVNGFYYYEFDSTNLTDVDTVRFICRNVDATYGKDLTVEVEFQRDETVKIHAVSVYDYVTGFFYAAAFGIHNQVLITDPVQCTFSVYNADGTIDLDPILDTTDVNGIFQITTSDFTPIANTSYYLRIVYEYGGQSYSHLLPFNVL